MHVIAMPPQPIAKTSSGYPGLERFTTSFGLPLSGMWRLEIVLNDVVYGDAVIPVAEPSWNVSPMFRSGAYEMRGIEKKAGFIDAGFIAGKSNKYMWHFWGTDAQLQGEFKVVAVKQGTSRLVDVFNTNSLGSKINGADRSAVSMMSLPEPGKWRLMAYLNDQLFTSIVVDVN